MLDAVEPLAAFLAGGDVDSTPTASSRSARHILLFLDTEGNQVGLHAERV